MAPRAQTASATWLWPAGKCNEAKDNRQPEEWLEELRKSKKAIDQRRAENLPKVLRQLKEPLRDTAMMNATRWRLYERLKGTYLPVECGTGARTKKQRLERGIPKAHYYDACCVGASTSVDIVINQRYVHVWSAVGRGTRRMCNTDAHGFPIGHRGRRKSIFGFQTGDLVTPIQEATYYEGAGGPLQPRPTIWPKPAEAWG